MIRGIIRRSVVFIGKMAGRMITLEFGEKRH